MLELEDVRAARDRIGNVARHTPLRYSHSFSAMTDAEVHLKLENLQRTGAFKIRGATNRLRTYSEAEREAGVVTASAGNHAQGVALAANRVGVDATIVMPEYASVAKVEATRDYGAEVVLHGEDYNEAAARAHEIEREEGRTYVHAFNDWAVMAGQGTIGLEILDDCPEVDTVLVPVGGGGLISGIATAIKGLDPDVRVLGVQPEGAAAAKASLEAGELVTLDSVETVADGVATRRIEEKSFRVIRERVDGIVTVSEADIATAILYGLERSKTLLEGAGALGLAALLADAFEYDEDEVVVPACCGGNIDMNTLTTALVRGQVEIGRYLKLRTVLPDRPGALEELAEVIAAHRANIYAFQHDRTSRDIGVNDAEVEMDLETRGPEHVEALLSALEAEGYEVEVLV